MSATPAVENRQSAIANRKSSRKAGADARRRRLFGLWKRVCEKRAIAGTREERLAYTSEKLGCAVQTWSTLRASDVGALVHAMQVEMVGASGAGPGEAERRSALRLRYALWLVPQVYGADWDALLHARLERQPYFFCDSVERLDPGRMRGLIEEMLDHLARKRAEAAQGPPPELSILDCRLPIGEIENRQSKIVNPDGPALFLSTADLRAAKEGIRREMIAAVRGKGKG